MVFEVSVVQGAGFRPSCQKIQVHLWLDTLTANGNCICPYANMCTILCFALKKNETLNGHKEKCSSYITSKQTVHSNAES